MSSLLIELKLKKKNRSVLFGNVCLSVCFSCGLNNSSLGIFGSGGAQVKAAGFRLYFNHLGRRHISPSQREGRRAPQGVTWPLQKLRLPVSPAARQPCVSFSTSAPFLPSHFCCPAILLMFDPTSDSWDAHQQPCFWFLGRWWNEGH